MTASRDETRSDGTALDPSQESKTPRDENKRHITVVIPAFNEEDAVGLVLEELPADLVDSVIVVDNASTDRTAEVAKAAGAIVAEEPERGYGAACLRGIDSVPEETTIVVFLDADHSDFPDDLPTRVAPVLASEAELVIGSRILGERESGAMVPQAFWGNKLAVTLIRAIWGHRYTDLGPFRVIRKDALDRLGMAVRDYGWTIEMQIRAIEEGLRLLERPVRYRRRIGQSKITGTIGGTVRAGSKILYTIGRHALRRLGTR